MHAHPPRDDFRVFTNLGSGLGVVILLVHPSNSVCQIADTP